MAEVLCPTCGRPNAAHREFCDFCGNPLDGALPVEPTPSSLKKDDQGVQHPDPLDEISRLDSLMPAPDTEPEPPEAAGSPTDPPDTQVSRLGSLLSARKEISREPEQTDPSHSGSPDEGSRLDDYLPPEEPLAEPDAGDDSSRLDEYLPPVGPEENIPLDLDKLSASPPDDSARLDDYLPPASPTEDTPEDLSKETNDQVSRLDDFFAKDPFNNPDPFQEPEDEDPPKDEFFSSALDPFSQPPGQESQKPAEEPRSFAEEFLSESSPEEPAQEKFGEDKIPRLSDLGNWDLPDPSPTAEKPEEKIIPEQSDDTAWEFLDSSPAPDKNGEEQAPQPSDPSTWDFLDPAPEPDKPEEGKTPEPVDAGEWDFLNPSPEPAKPEEDQTPEPVDAGAWDFLDPAPEPDKPEEGKTPEPVDAGEWDFLDPAPELDRPKEGQTTEPVDVGEFDFLNPAPEPDKPKEGQTTEPVEVGEFDFLDPPPTAESLPETREPEGQETEDDLSFLDPGPTAELEHSGEEPEFEPEDIGEDSGWLDMLQDPGGTESFGVVETSPPEAPKPQTDWLDKIKRLNKSSDLVDEDSSFPDWLSVSGKPTGPIDPSQEDSSGAASSGVPDWLHLEDDESLNEFLRKKDLTNEEYKPKITTDSLDDGEIPDEEDTPASGLSDSQQIKFPSWAEDEKKKSKDLQFMAEYQDQTGPLDSVEPFQIEEEIFDDLFSEELPGWLTATSSKEVTQSRGEELTQGELPGWVEAMRPVVESTDASGLADDEDYIENYGPLAGIPSVLPAEAEIGIDINQAVQKPLDLLATNSHKDYVKLIENLISEEIKSKDIQRPSRLQTQRVLRWLIGAILLIAIAGTVIFGGTAEIDPPTAAQIRGSGFGALHKEIEMLSEEQPVLIAYDYQPAAAGELHIAAASVVDHLMEQGTYLSFVSTQPTGPALAEQFLDATRGEHEYYHTQKYINLGYLPGESAGLLSFMIAPRKIIPLAFDGSNAWDSPPLADVVGISDFKMILVITDDPNTAKIWIEQVGRHLEDTPLTMVVSAQVEPLIQPYFRSTPRLLSGYVAGLIDSMNYEQLTDRPNLASKVWIPFNMGIFVSVGIIFISGLANGVLSLFSRRSKKITGDKK